MSGIKSEDVLGNKLDSCLADATVKIGAGGLFINQPNIIYFILLLG